MDYVQLYISGSFETKLLSCETKEAHFAVVGFLLLNNTTQASRI